MSHVLSPVSTLTPTRLLRRLQVFESRARATIVHLGWIALYGGLLAAVCAAVAWLGVVVVNGNPAATSRWNTQTPGVAQQPEYVPAHVYDGLDPGWYRCEP